MTTTIVEVLYSFTTSNIILLGVDLIIHGHTASPQDPLLPPKPNKELRKFLRAFQKLKVKEHHLNKKAFRHARKQLLKSMGLGNGNTYIARVLPKICS